MEAGGGYGSAPSARGGQLSQVRAKPKGLLLEEFGINVTELEPAEYEIGIQLLVVMKNCSWPLKSSQPQN